MPQVLPTILPANISLDTTLDDRIAAAMSVGNQWYVNETTGNDSAAGSTIGAPFATLGAALAAATPNNGDVIYLTGTVHLTSTLQWNVNGVSLVGLQAPSNNSRARISAAAVLTQPQATALSPLVNVTAQGCSFVNIEAFLGFANTITPPAAPVCWAANGGRNNYKGCQFSGGGDAVSAAAAGMRSLTIGGSFGESVFEDCTVGLDTITRITNANATLEFLANAYSPRCVFRRCIFQALSGLATNVHVLVSAAGIDRYALFDKCTFINAINTGATTMNVDFTVTGTAGLVLLQDCASVGATVFATAGPIYVTGPVPTGATSGLAVAAT